MIHGVFLSFTECYNYKVLNETSRSKTYNESYFQCDNTLSTDWYRFSGAAGNQMAESCVEMYRCGTYSPGWLNGSHPTVNEGAVQRRVCFGDYSGDCCLFSIYIRVRNCGRFYVYQLKPLTECFVRYCGNGYVSSTPTTPGTLFPSFCIFSCINFLFVLRIKHLAFIDEINKGHIACLQMVKMNGQLF